MYVKTKVNLFLKYWTSISNGRNYWKALLLSQNKKHTMENHVNTTEVNCFNPLFTKLSQSCLCLQQKPFWYGFRCTFLCCEHSDDQLHKKQSEIAWQILSQSLERYLSEDTIPITLPIFWTKMTLCDPIVKNRLSIIDTTTAVKRQPSDNV